MLAQVVLPTVRRRKDSMHDALSWAAFGLGVLMVPVVVYLWIAAGRDRPTRPSEDPPEPPSPSGSRPA